MTEQMEETVEQELAEQEEIVPEEPVQEEAVQDKKEQKDEVLSGKRRTALVAYLAILFAAAFLLVAVSMIMENKRLQDSNSQNTATLNGKIADLQDEYNQLQKQSKAQESSIASLEEELSAAQSTAEEQAASIEQLTGDLEAMTAQNETLAAEKEDLTKAQAELAEQNETLTNEKQELAEKVGNLEQVYDLLIRAQAADESGDYELLAELLEQIEPLKDLLSENAAELYEALIID